MQQLLIPYASGDERLLIPGGAGDLPSFHPRTPQAVQKVVAPLEDSHQELPRKRHTPSGP